MNHMYCSEKETDKTQHFKTSSCSNINFLFIEISVVSE